MRHRRRITFARSMFGSTVFALTLLTATSQRVDASHSNIAPCPLTSGTTTNPPTSTIVVRIFDIKPNSDLEGDDDHVPFYDNHADIYGFVTIAGETFDLAERTDTDFPHWDESNGVFRKQITGPDPVHIAIEIKEADGGITGDDDNVDVSPLADDNILDLDFDLCSLKLTGDAGELPTQNIITVKAGDESTDATIRFEIEFEDGRPVTVEDLAIVDVDLVQVLYDQTNIVAGKPTIVAARVANNHPQEVTTNLSAFVSFGLTTFSETIPITIFPGQVKSFELFTTTPIIFPPGGSYVPFVRVSVVDPSSAPPDDCRHQNDEFVSGAPVIPAVGTLNGPPAFWTVVTMKTPHITWAPVGRLLDTFNCASDNKVNAIRDLGSAFIRGVYPIPDVENHSNPLPVCITPPIVDALDFLTTLLVPFQIPADALVPFALVFELNYVGAASAEDTSVDRLIGILPSDWFRVFLHGLWSQAFGLSGTEFAPHAVILEGTSLGFPIMQGPGHEMGHTFGLSVSPDVKSWICDQDFPGDIDALACGATGGLDEVNGAFPEGDPAMGYWIRRGNEPPTIAEGIFGQQCNSHCLMGGGVPNDFQDWGLHKHWIDAADYDRLLEKLHDSPLAGQSASPVAHGAQATESIFISGMIGYADQVYLGTWFRRSNVVPDRTDPFGLYSFRFKDAAGNVLGEVGIPINWNQPDVVGGIPVTIFGLYVPFPAGTDYVDIVNTQSGETIGTKNISPTPPTVQITQPTPGEIVADCALRIAWQANDQDGDPLTFLVMLNPVGADPYPVGVGIEGNEFTLNASSLPMGPYEVKVIANDGANTGTSPTVAFTLAPDPNPDSTPPTLTVTLNPNQLWPANHKMASIHAEVTATDAEDTDLTIELVSITSDEPANGLGDGDIGPDVEGAAIGTEDYDFQLRAERGGLLDGRVYTVTYRATDDCGNSVTATAEVVVARDRRGVAQASWGFTPDGAGIDPKAKEIAVVLPSFVLEEEEPVVVAGQEVIGPEMVSLLCGPEAVRASAIDPEKVQIGNLAGTLAPIRHGFVDADGDAERDLIVYYDAAWARQAIANASEETGAVGIHYVSPEGRQLFVPSLVGLGAPVLAGVDADPTRPGSGGHDLEPTSPGSGTDAASLPAVTRLVGVRPNPFQGIARIALELSSDRAVQVEVIDPQGRMVRRLAYGVLPAGRHQLDWNGRDAGGARVNPGVYLIRVTAGDYVGIRKAVLFE